MAHQYASKQGGGFKNHVEKVAIVGAGGQVGKFIAEALLKTGRHKVTAITRAGSTSEIPQGAEVKKINYDDHASIVEALRGQEALIITMAVTAPPDQQSKLIQAAAAANVPWVLPNWFGSDPMHEGMQKDSMLGAANVKIRSEIETLGKSSWITIVCGFWYEFSLSGTAIRYGFDFQNRTVTLYDDGTTKINTSTWPQIGLGLARLLSLKVLPDDEHDKSACLSQFKNKSVYISSFHVSQKDMLDSVLRVTGTTVSDWKVEHEPVKDRYMAGVKELQSGNELGFGKLLYARAFYTDNAGNFEVTQGLHNDILGLPKEDIDEYTKLAIEMAG